jgi:pilus assembly protein CpaC
MTGQRKWAAVCGVPMFIIGVFGTPHATLAQVAPGPTVTAALPAGAIPGPGADVIADPSSVRLLVGRSTLVDVGAPISRVSLTSADVADALVTSPNQLLVHGKVPGSISMFVWNRGGSVKRYEIVVQRDLAALGEQMKTLFPGEAIQVHSNGKQVVLSGNVSRKEIAEKAIAVAGGYVDKKEDVVTLLVSQPGPGSSQVLLRVRFAEVSRNALTELGASFFTSPTGIKNTVGRATTQQFAAPTFSDLAWTKENGDFGSPVTSAEGKLNFSDFLNLFFLNQKYDLGVVIKAMQQRGLFQSLAEPNLVAESGKEASFLAGGEIPIPIAQGSGANLAISVQYKEYGVRLNFTPTVNGDRVHLKVKPEVSTLDFGNSVVMNGFRIPALSTRRTETEIELRNGQTFAIAGLLSNQMQSTMQKIPGIGDIPILGLLFRSKAAQKNQTELVVMITPEILPPDSPGVTPTLPRMPETFLAPVSDKQLKPTPPPAFTTRPRSQADNANGTAPAAPVVVERSAIDRAQDQARQQLEREEQARTAAAAVAVASQPVEAPRAAAKPEDVRRAAEKQAQAEAKQHAVEQKRMDAMQREQAKKDAEAAAKAQKEEARKAEADRKQAEKLAQEQARQDAVAAKQKAKADKQAAEAAKKKDAEAKRNGQEPKGQAEVLQERQRAIDAATERLRASEAEYQAELAKRSSR